MNKRKRLVILSGAGLDEESGISTFRDSSGLWENHKIEDVATPEGWLNNPALVLKFYNERRQQLKTVKPNEAHKIIAKLEKHFDVFNITQNVSDLLERGGSTNVLHLHGELTKARSSGNANTIKDIGYEDMQLGDLCEDGFPIRPHIVWFKEPVPLIHKAEDIVCDADIFLIIGTSLQVYPAAGLVIYTDKNIPIYIIDPKGSSIMAGRKETTTIIKKKAVDGMKELYDLLVNKNMPIKKGWYWVLFEKNGEPLPCWYEDNCFLPGGLNGATPTDLGKNGIFKVGPEIEQPKF